MEKKMQSFFDSFLKGAELLQNRGIRYEAWDEYERSSKVLPKTGKKLFEPNGSWLQQKQIEKGLQHRKDLLNMERIERKSQLAIAEWLPNEKKVRVLKKSGQEWTNFGLEVNGVLYLIPEEALLLLEMNCIELIWEGVAITLQQAYNILLDSDTSECTLEEYKVYSQFLRCGYRVQRCLQPLMKKRTSMREAIFPRKKMIISTLNGLRISNDCSQRKEDTGISGNKSNKSSRVAEKRSLEEINNEKDNANDTRFNSIVEVLETIISDLESKEQKKIFDNKDSDEKTQSHDFLNYARNEKITSIAPDSENQRGAKKNNPKVEIISQETVLENVKILKDISRENGNTENNISQGLGTRIKRNVKLLPKRTDQVSMSTSVPESSQITANENTSEMKLKRNALLPLPDCSISKKQRQEIIELSDDEVEEVRTPLSRMEMLNQLPNIASQDLKITPGILKGYMPPNIELRRDVYHFEQKKWLFMQRADYSNRLSERNTQNIQYSASNQNVNESFAFPSTSTNLNQRPSVFNNYSYVQKAQINSFQNNNYRMHNNQFFNFQYFQWNFSNKNPLLQQNSHLQFQHIRKQFWLQNRHIQAHNYNNALLGLMGNIMKSYSVRNQFPHNLQSVPPYHAWRQSSSIERRNNLNLSRPSRPSLPNQRPNDNNHHQNFNRPKIITNSNKVQGPSTWSELKKKWQEERTITINDEDAQEAIAGKDKEIEIVEQGIKPLIIIKRNTRLSEVTEKLKLIKEAGEKSQRQKECDYNISYNVYLGGSQYKKANPGPPMCRVLVIREDEDHLNPLDVRRLPLNERDPPLVIAYVSKTSISYIQLGSVSIPDLN